MAFSLPELPYGRGDLAPHISEETLNYHHGKHHQAYVTNLNGLIEGTDLANATLEEIINKAAGDKSKAGLFNNAAQVWNHTFYWHSMKPGGGGKPTGKVAEMIDRDLGGYDQFIKDFKAAGGGQFGSGWAWLVEKDGKLAITKTPNAETPLTEAGVTPILTMDVWEHAYYLDYQNSRPNYMDAFLNSLINWDFANKNLA
ncbi:MAG: superoxide dismutase [Hyphomonas sp. BRH_c22]|uniref:superoxide dismutase n=1 Tax=Hyphomonas sp. BRH_c22 TaxID=1629710 RepID=UPI0005F21231|nr:superoxide dismutase [Hyphomonas sp. BRH_c22]KJS38715.1 MAG: superoxide dismutase [Hyphomonas sp. BRH_c22]